MKDERQWKGPALELIEHGDPGDPKSDTLRTCIGGSLADCAAQMIADFDKRCGPDVDLTDIYQMLANISEVYAHRNPSEPFEATELSGEPVHGSSVQLTFTDAE